MEDEIKYKPPSSCSRELYAESSKTSMKRRLNETIIIESDSDSDYETGSDRLSPSSTNSSKSAIQGSKEEKMQPQNKCYAYLNDDRKGFGPWELVDFTKRTVANRYQKSDAAIVIIDSDSENETQSTKTPGVSASTNSDIITIDSDDDDELEAKFIVTTSKGVKKNVPEYSMARATPPTTALPMQTRVIARRKKDMLPVGYSREHGVYSLYHNDDEKFYPGIISAKRFMDSKTTHYLVFFDDGHSQYCDSTNIRSVFGNYKWKYAHANARDFYRYYFESIEKKGAMELQLNRGNHLRIWLDSTFESAQVVDVDPDRPGLVQVDFVHAEVSEWLYTGSLRIETIWKTFLKDERLRKKYHDANTTMIEVSSGSEDEENYRSPEKRPLSANAKDPDQNKFTYKPELLISNFKVGEKLDRKHVCGKLCVRKFEENKEIFDHDLLKRPLLAGWSRNTTGLCIYTTPCGRTFHTLDSTYAYLKCTRSKLTIDCFSFSSKIDCMTEVQSHSSTGRKQYLNDIVPGGWREKQQIPVVSIVDNVPHFAEYVTKNKRNQRSKKVPAILDESDNPFRTGCDCDGDCSDKSKCSCWQLTLDGLNRSENDKKMHKRVGGYEFKRLEDRVETGIYECNPSCKCSSKCLNRVVKSQIEQKLELFETKNRGFGIRCQTDIPKGTFVSCYYGDLLHGKTADERAGCIKNAMYGDEYFMQLDHIEVAEKYKEGYESDVEEPDTSLNVTGNTPKRARLQDAHDRHNRPNHVNNSISYFPAIKKSRACVEVNPRTLLFGEKAVEFVIDGRYRGNISRFYNHSCKPNLFPQTVFIDTHDLRFPSIAFFAARDIKAGKELTWFYGYAAGSIEGREIECKCGAPQCCKRLL